MRKSLRDQRTQARLQGVLGELVGRGRVVLVAGDAGTVTPMPQLAGLADLMDGSASFSEAIHRDANSRLHVIPAGRTSRKAQADIGSVLDALRETYDVVVLGMPHALDADEAHAVAHRAEIAVVGPGAETQARELVASLTEAGIGHVLRVQGRAVIDTPAEVTTEAA